jgi:hypothetical protein
MKATVIVSLLSLLVACRTASPAPTERAQYPLPNAERDDHIRKVFGDSCRLERSCGKLWGIDCMSASDGPYYYVKQESLDVISRCGGNCMAGHCERCPPPAWTCPTY